MMKILQCGVPKSGNFWLYKIIQQLLLRDGRDTTSFIERHPIYPLAKQWELNFPEQARIDVLDVTDLNYSYRISSIFQMPIDDINTYVSQSPHIWSHSPICKRSVELLSLFDKKIYIIRDPRDRAISAAKYYCSEYMMKFFPQPEKTPEKYLKKHFNQLMHTWVWHVFDFLRLSNSHDIHITFFEGFLLSFQQELSRLLEYMDINLNEYERAALERAVSFESLKEKNPKHLKKGEFGYWKEVLTDEQIEMADVMAGPLIRHLNYPAERHHAIDLSQDVSLNEPEVLKQAIIESQNQLYVR